MKFFIRDIVERSAKNGALFNITSEAFAHMFEAQFDKTRYDEMKKYFPESLGYFDQEKYADLLLKCIEDNFDYTIEKYGTVVPKKMPRPEIIWD